VSIFYRSAIFLLEKYRTFAP